MRHPMLHPLGAVIAAYLRAKGVVPEQLALFDIDCASDARPRMGRLVTVYPTRGVVNVPTGGVL